MPAYNTQNPPPAVYTLPPEHQVVLFSAEAVIVGEYSQQFSLYPQPNAGPPSGRIVIDFSADPGNFEFDFMESDSDVLGATGYQQVPASSAITQANKTTGPNGANTRVAADYNPFLGPFGCLYVKTVPSNAGIKVTARFTRTS